jgi:SLT domain-containing protein
VSLPHIKLPHFVIEPLGWQLGDLLQGIIPHLGIDWYAQGGIFNSPRVIGVGDSKSPEAVIPIDKLQSMINASNAQMVSALVTAMQAMNAGDNGKPVELVVNLGGAQVATQIFKLNKQGQIIMEA